MKYGRSGMTLLEVLMASVILGLVLVGLMQGMSQCFRAYALARRMQEMQTVLSAAEVVHPMIIDSDPVEDLAVDADNGLRDGYVFERECLEDEDEDDIYLVKSSVTYGSGGPGSEIKTEQYVYFKE